MSLDAISPRRRNPWSVVFGAGIAQSVSAQPLVLSTFSLFVLPIAAATGWSRTSILGVFTACAIGLALGLPLVGRLIDRFPVRRILVISWLGYCACIAAVAITPLSLPLFYLPFFLIGLFTSGVLIPCTKAVVTWLDTKRGAGIGVMAALMSLGTTFMPLIAAYLIRTTGFREAYLWLALLALIVGLTLILTLVRSRDEPDGIVPVRSVIATGRTDHPGLGVAEALATRHFWLITFSLCLAAVCLSGLQTNLVPIMLDRGTTTENATLALAVFGFSSLLGRLGGILLDRIHGTRVGAAVLLLAALGITLLLVGGSFISGLIGAMLVGVAFGIEVDLLGFLTSRYFGMRRFGSVMGVLQGAVMLCIAIGPIVVGLAYDKLGSYEAVLPLLIGAFLLCAVAILLLGPYAYPAVPESDGSAKADASGEREVI
jgi:MFS family permease